MEDAGVLIHSKFNKWGVLFWNTVINLTSIIGTIIGLMIGGVGKSSSSYSMAFIAGNFIYISLSAMLPMTLKNKSVIQNVLYFTFFCVGIGIMFIMLLMED